MRKPITHALVRLHWRSAIAVPQLFNAETYHTCIGQALLKVCNRCSATFFSPHFCNRLRKCSGGATFLYKDADIKLRTAEEKKNVIAEIQMQLWSNISLKICGNAVGTVLPSSCGVVIADMKKNLCLSTSDLPCNILLFLQYIYYFLLPSKGQFHEIWDFFQRKSIVLRSTPNVFKNFMLCCHWVIQFKRSNAVSEIKLTYFLCK
jgi:hypothetical protein